MMNKYKYNYVVIETDSPLLHPQNTLLELGGTTQISDKDGQLKYELRIENPEHRFSPYNQMQQLLRHRLNRKFEDIRPVNFSPIVLEVLESGTHHRHSGRALTVVLHFETEFFVPRLPYPTPYFTPEQNTAIDDQIQEIINKTLHTKEMLLEWKSELISSTVQGVVLGYTDDWLANNVVAIIPSKNMEKIADLKEYITSVQPFYNTENTPHRRIKHRC